MGPIPNATAESTVKYSNSTCLQEYPKPKELLFLVPKKVLKQNNQELKKKKKIKNITHLLRKMLERRTWNLKANMAQ